MPTLPADIIPSEFIATLAALAPLFSGRVFAHAQVLLIGAILTPGRRTVAAALRAMGLAQERHFQNYHRVLSRATTGSSAALPPGPQPRYHRVLSRAEWSSRLASRTLLRILVQTFAPVGTLVMGIDETLERRRGDRIAARGVYRDAVRSSRSFFAKSSGLRWVSLMLLCPIPWAQRVWALPFLTALAPSATTGSAASGTKS
jgi:hypothetical protein